MVAKLFTPSWFERERKRKRMIRISYLLKTRLIEELDLPKANLPEKYIRRIVFVIHRKLTDILLPDKVLTLKAEYLEIILSYLEDQKFDNSW